jgi:hypothetical protein
VDSPCLGCSPCWVRGGPRARFKLLCLIIDRRNAAPEIRRRFRGEFLDNAKETCDASVLHMLVSLSSNNILVD